MRLRSLLMGFPLLGLVAMVLVPAVLAQPAAPVLPTAEALSAKKSEVAAELAEAGGAGETGASRELLQEIDRLLSEQVAVIARGEATVSVPVSPGEGAQPLSFRQFDATARALAEARAVADSAQRALGDTQAAVEASSSALERAEKARRLAKEERVGGRASADALRRAELESRIEDARLGLRRLELGYWQQQRDRARERLAEQESELAYQAANLTASESEQSAILAQIDKDVFDLERRHGNQQYAVEEAERMLARAQAAYELESDAAHRAEREARRAALLAEQRIATLLAEHRSRLEASRVLWDRRFRLLREDIERGMCATWEEETAAAAADLERERRLKTARRGELERELAVLGAGDPGSATRSATLGRLTEAYRDELALLDEHRFLTARLLAALDERSNRLHLFDRLDALRGAGSAVWQYELWSSDDSPITVAKVFSALAVFVAGFFLARVVSRSLGRRVFARLRHDEGAVHAFEALAFYLFLVLVFLTALRVVNIPLTAFAVLGGALAICVGFGSQNVVNNFISGVILLAERPIKLGDLIEMGDVYGTVERIGLRSTRVRTGDNVHIILPNASILEGQVINWTHNDQTVRVRLNVGIAYGSPTREAERLILQALIAHPKVHATPEPLVLFMDFGNDALMFEARFWVTMRSLLDRLRIESELRYEIDDAFREAGITIAFPQRDVHLDTLKPLDVRMVGRGETE